MNLIELLNTIPKIKKNIVIFDIDDTLINTTNWLENKPIVDFYKYLINNGYNTAIITARENQPYVINNTIKDLESIGVTNYKYLIFMNYQQENDILKYKENARKYITNQGYEPIMSIGDKYWDMGKYGGIGILVSSRN